MEGFGGIGPGLILFSLLSLWPARRILVRAGLEPWWCLLVLVPMAGHAVLYGVLAVRRWPSRPAVPVTRAPKARRALP